MTAAQTSPYGEAALTRELRAVREAANGSRNQTLNRAAFALGQLAAGGHVNADEARSRLTEAAALIGLEPREAENTIASGWRAGEAEPRQVESRPTERSRRNDRPIRLGRIGEWAYLDRDGRVLYRKVRIALSNGGKEFIYEHPDGRGGWAQGRKAEPVPYRLPELLSADPTAPVFTAEGEKKADRLAEWGLVATSHKDFPRSGFEGLLTGRTVIILPDNDEAGATYAKSMMGIVERAGGRPVMLALPGLFHGGDILDWTGDREHLIELTDAAMAAPQSEVGTDPSTKRPAYLNGISAAALMAKQFEPVRYVVPGLIAEGATLFAGKPKLGKSWMAYDFALAIASGRPVFGRIPVAQGDVLYLALEDSQRRLRSRLVKKGVAAPERLTLATEWPDLDNGCLHELDAWANAVEQPTLVIIDVLKMVRPATRHNEGVYDADYRALSPLAAWARSRGLAVLVVHHTRKAAADDPLEEISGTNGVTGAADTVMVLKRDIGTGNCILYVRGRDVEEAEKAVRFRPDNGTWELLGEAEEVGRTNERQAILDTLRGQRNPLSAREISDILGKSYDAIRKTLTRMAHAGELRKIGRGLYTCPSSHNVPSTRTPDNGTLGTGHVRSEQAGVEASLASCPQKPWHGEPDDPAAAIFGGLA